MLNLQQLVGPLLDDAEVEDDVIVGDAGRASQQLFDLRLAAADLVEHLLDAVLQIRQDLSRTAELGSRRVSFFLGRLDLVLEEEEEEKEESCEGVEVGEMRRVVEGYNRYVGSS